MRPWIYPTLGPPLSAWMTWYFTEDVQGLEHFPDHGPAILAANHISHIDPIVLCQLGWKHRPRQELRYLAKRELFEKQPLAYIMWNGGQIPVDRGTSSASDSLASAREAIEDGQIMAVFPEGTISLTYVPMRAHSGTARLALDTGAPVIPIGLWGTHRSMTKFRDRELKRHRPVTVDIGAPRVYTEADGEVNQVADMIMDEIVTLVDTARARYPEKPAPEDWWGPPTWPIERAGRWRPSLTKDMSPEESFAEAHRAMNAPDGPTGPGPNGTPGPGLHV